MYFPYCDLVSFDLYAATSFNLLIARFLFCAADNRRIATEVENFIFHNSMNTGYNEQKQQQHSLHKARSLSRQILGSDMDLVNKYATKYTSNSMMGRVKRSQTYNNVQNPYNQSYGGYNQSYAPSANYGMNRVYNHGYNSSSNSSNSNNSNNYSNNKKSRRQPSNLINPHTFNQWDQSSVNSQQSDMSEAMSLMVNSYQSKLEKEADFLDEMEEEAMHNESFGDVQRAEDWSVKEVCYWLNRIHLD